MLYCPKCQRTYEEGSQRFCSNEGEKLLRTSAAGESANQTNGIFTYTLNRKNKGVRSKFSTIPELSENEAKIADRPRFDPPDNAFKSEAHSETKLGEISNSGAAAQNEQTDSELASVCDEKLTFSFDNAGDLIGRAIKNRYRIVEQIGADENGVVYLAEDNSADRKIALKILSVEDLEDSFTNEVFAAERLALAQMNHPNIANVFDSGELSDGKPYLVTEYVEGVSIKEELEKNGRFDALRAARIVRQATDALEAAHQNRVLHRSLKPENIVLTPDENGIERVRVTNFGGARERLNERNLLYKSPEQIEGKISNAGSDVYTLAVIAYQMLTSRLPFNASSVGDLLRSQREGLRIRPSDVRFDLPASIDEILKKALSFNSFNRFPQARDFGDEFFSEIIAHASFETEAEIETISAEAAADENIPAAPKTNETNEKIETLTPSENLQPQNPFTTETTERERKKTTRDLSAENKSFDPLNETDPRHRILPIFGVTLLLAALLSAAYYFTDRQNRAVVVQKSDVVTNINVAQKKPIETDAGVAATSETVEMPPPARAIKPPPDAVYFQNNKDSLAEEAAKNFLGFSLYYPKDWARKAVENNFLDVSRVARNNLPIEQMLVSYYNSNGTFNADAEIFPTLVKETNATLEKIVPDYQMVSEGPTTINNGWRAYEVKFQGTGRTSVGGNITLWGRRLFVPRAIRGMKNGYVLTMLATSLSENVKNVDDVGVKGELANILQTFEPNQSF